MKKKLLNLLIFQVGWLVCVIGGNYYAIAYTLVALACHHYYVLENSSEWQLVAIVAVVGSLWDIVMVFSGLIHFTGPGLLGVPIWLICLWVLFATTFMHALSWLRHYLWIAAILAAALGPASYWLGTELSNAEISAPILLSLSVMALGWSILFPMGIYLTRRYLF
jgi:hypothetical protein